MCRNETVRAVPPETLQRAIEHQGGRCLYCGCEMILPDDMPAKNSPAMERLARELGIEPFSSRWQERVKYHRATAEHLVPHSQGGSDEPGNISAACAFCNSRRGHLPINEARAEIEELIRQGKHPCIRT
ncbi:MAG: HNH endonuclease [bacterium]|nr:HNH endonuclease [bacterium]